MKENPDIEELLNSFIDGEMTERQQTEIRRLISHDAQAAQRLRELQECKMLVNSLPCAEAPAGMAEQIKTSLEGRAILAQAYSAEAAAKAGQPSGFDEREGARHLLVRKVLAAAAMIGLVAILAAVIYTIVVPESGPERPIVVEDWPQPDREVVAVRPSIVATGFNGRLELKTSNLVGVDAFINRAIEDNGLSDCISPKAEGDKNVYALSCSREAVSLLLADLENVWEKFDSATLFVETDQFAERVTVDAVTSEQIAEIVNQDSLDKRIELAKDFAFLNNMAELLPGKEIFAAIDDRGASLITIPKPVLTRPQETIKKPASQTEDKVQVHLTIVLAGSE